MVRSRILLALLLALIPSLASAQGTVSGNETLATVSGSNIAIVSPNTPATNFASPNGTNIFLIPIANPSVSLRVYITNNTAIACNNFTAQIWAASDPQVSSFKNSLANWQTIPLQSTNGSLVASLAVSIPASGITYFDSTAISSPRIALQLIDTAAGCPNTNIEVTAVITSVTKTSPLISTSGPTGFANTGTQVQGVIAQGVNASSVNPVISGAVQPPTNALFNTVGLDGVTSSFSVIPPGTSTAIQLGTSPSVAQPEFLIAFENGPSDVGAGSVLFPPWQCVANVPQSCTSGGEAVSTTVATSRQAYIRSWSNSGVSNANDSVIILSLSNSTATVRQTAFSASSPVAFGTNVLAGSALLAMAGGSSCVVTSMTDTQGLSWSQVSALNPNAVNGFAHNLTVWMATATSSAAADSVTINNTGTCNQLGVFEVTGQGVAPLNTPAISIQADTLGNIVTRLDAQAPNQFRCTVTLSTATTTQFTGCGVATTVNGIPARYYVTDIQIQTTTAGTASTVQLSTGTGSNCGTGNAALSAILYSTATVGLQTIVGARTPLVTPLQTAVCLTQAGTAGTVTTEIRGFLAP